MQWCAGLFGDRRLLGSAAVVSRPPVSAAGLLYLRGNVRGISDAVQHVRHPADLRESGRLYVVDGMVGDGYPLQFAECCVLQPAARVLTAIGVWGHDGAASTIGGSARKCIADSYAVPVP